MVNKDIQRMSLSSAMSKDDRVFKLSAMLKSKKNPLIPTIHHAAKALELSPNTVKHYPNHETSTFSLYDTKRDRWVGNSSLSTDKLNAQLFKASGIQLKKLIEQGRVFTVSSAEKALSLPRSVILEVVVTQRIDLYDDQTDAWLIYSSGDVEKAKDDLLKKAR